MILREKKYGLFDIFRISISSNSKAAILIIIIKICNGIIPSLQIIATSEFINRSILVLDDKVKTQSVIIPILLVVMFVAYMWIAEQILKYLEVGLEISLRKKINNEMIYKVSTLSYEYIEDSDKRNLIYRVSEEPEKKIRKAYLMILSAISLLVEVFGILVILFLKVWWTPFIIFFGSVILFYFSFKSGKVIYNATRDVSKEKRKYKYLGEVLSERDYTDERTLFGYSRYIINKWINTYDTVQKIVIRSELLEIVKIQCGTIITSFISIFIIIILINPLLSGKLTIGLFISIVGYVIALIKTMSSDLPWYTREIAKAEEYLKDLSEFINFKVGNTGHISFDTLFDFKSLEFKNVKFKYPGTNKEVLNGISFIITKGYHYAFVGINGSGKTTIIKLILGLYNNYEGEILLNGIDINQYDYNYRKSLFSVVFQDYARYYIPVKDNINIRNVNSNTNQVNNYSFEKAISVLELRELINSLPQGLETVLGKIKKDGIDISEGEWQRIAMARAIVNPGILNILDEPTSAMDPISESKLYEKFNNISEGKTTILISHRLGATKLADKIFILNLGRIVEEGSHEQLIEKGGIYAKMYKNQKGWYC